MLTWWQGDISVHGFGLGEDVIADDTYTDIAHVRAGNGLQADLHEFQLTPQGTALITAYDPIMCDLSSVGGPADGRRHRRVMQEIDVTTGLVMYEWTSVDHVALERILSNPRALRARAYPFDFFHLNSINVDRDGSLLVSAATRGRSTTSNAATGQIRWRLGGKHSSFTRAAGTRTAWQHDPRELPDGAISIFDNGASPKVHRQSRGDRREPRTEPSGTVTLLERTDAHAAAGRRKPGQRAGARQRRLVRRLGPGTVLLGVQPRRHAAVRRAPPRARPVLSRVPLPLDGQPAHLAGVRPRCAGSGGAAASLRQLERRHAGRLLAGARRRQPHELAPVAQAPRTGFETAFALPGGITDSYMAVQALGASEEVLGTSAVASEAGAG